MIPRSMVTGKLRRLEGARYASTGSLHPKPRALAKGLRFAFQLGLALGGWFPAAGRDICFVPNGFSRAAQEHGQQSGANKLAGAPSCRRSSYEIDWLQGLFEENLYASFCAELILWTSRTGD